MSTLKLTAKLDAFNALFTQLAKQPNNVCWIRSLDFKRQLYLSPQFESIWERPINVLYDNPVCWYDFLLPFEMKSIHEIFADKIAKPEMHDGNNIVFYRVKTPGGEVKYIRDYSILLSNNYGQAVAVGGVAEIITPELWHQANGTDQTNRVQTVLPGNQNLMTILESESNIYQPSQKSEVQHVNYIKINGLYIGLSSREADCLYHLRLGKTAKETAKTLNISHRTVETHLENVKQKSLCRSKLELMSQLAPITQEELAGLKEPIIRR